MAAETFDPSTALPAANSDELLLVDFRAFIAQACKSLDEAERLVIEFANGGHLKHVRSTGGYIDPRHWGRCHEGLGSFTPVDFDNSMVRYIRLPADQARAYLLRQELDELLKKDFYGPSYKEMRLVRLWRSDALALLRWAGLPLPTQQIGPVNDPAVATSAMSAPVTTAASNPPPPKLRSLPKSIAKKLAGKPQMLRVALALWQEFPNGKAPRSLSGKQCARKLSSYWEADRKRGLKDPHPEACRRTMKLLGRTAD